MKLFELLDVIDSSLKLRVYQLDEHGKEKVLYDYNKDGGDFPFDLLPCTVVYISPISADRLTIQVH